jgi:Family of unknown function (DUF5309)
MAIYSTTSNQVAALKELYTGDDYMKDLVYKKNPLLALIPKNESPGGFAGKYIPVPLIYGTPQGRSATFTNSQNNQTAPALSSFFVYRVSNYQLCTITNELLEATKDNAGAFIDEAKLNMDTSIRNISNDLALDLFSAANGVRGQISSISTGVITLVSPASVVNFEVGMSLVSFSISGTTYTQSTSAAVGYIIAVDRSNGIITVSATQGGSAGTPTNWSTSFPNLAVQGDVAFGSNTLQTQFLKVSGLAAWLPMTAPTNSDNFWGVNRSADVTRLSGVRFNGSSETIEEALIDASSLVAREGGMPDMCFMSFASYAALEKSLGSKVQYVDVKHEEADIAFTGIKIHAPYGPITVIPDRSCPPLTAYLLQMDTWKFRSLGKAPHILTYGLEGLEGLRVGNADALEIRIGYYGNLICNAPGWNCVVSLSS